MGKDSKTGRTVHKRKRNVDPDKVEHVLNRESLLLLKQINEKCTIAIIKTHNLQIEISQLRAEQAKLARLYLALLHDPTHVGETVDWETLKGMSHVYDKPQ